MRPADYSAPGQDDTDKRYKTGRCDDRETLRWLRRPRTAPTDLTHIEETLLMQHLCTQSDTFACLQLSVQQMRKLLAGCRVRNFDRDTVLLDKNRVERWVECLPPDLTTVLGH